MVETGFPQGSGHSKIRNHTWKQENIAFRAVDHKCPKHIYFLCEKFLLLLGTDLKLSEISLRKPVVTRLDWEWELEGETTGVCVGRKRYRPGYTNLQNAGRYGT